MNKFILNHKVEVPTTCKAVIATTQQGGVMLIRSEPDIIDLDVVADCYLDDYIESLQPGKVYKCTIRWHTYQSNHPLDPIEYDMDVFIENLEEINLT